MTKFDFSTTCLDLEQATQIYPSLCQSANKQGQLWQHYLDEDLFFRQNFCSLFLLPPRHHSHYGPFSEDPIQKSLLRLQDLALNDDLGPQIAQKMKLKIDRASQTCMMLDLLLQEHRPRREDREDQNNPPK